MTAVNPLFEFMPYGAPELIAAQRSHQMRALVLASGIAIVAFALPLALGLKLADPMPVEVRVRDRSVQIDGRRQKSIADPRTDQPRVRVKPDPRSIPLPVPDDLAPPAKVIDEGGPVDGAEGNVGEGRIETQPGGTATVEEPLPVRGEYVYTDVMPAVVISLKPKYPDMAEELGIAGRVYVHMLVGKDGRVVKAEVDPKFSVPMLDESALTAARQFVFTPALANGHPVSVWVGQMFVYRAR